MEQCASTILMIRPVQFRMNEQTAVNNYYQKVLDNVSPDEVQARALEEFDNFADKLRDNGIQVIDVDDTEDPDTPDSIFPNNWISFHEDGSVALYPMFAPNRRLERREEIIHYIADGFDLEVSQIIDFTEFEDHERFLEGTGSIVLDRVNRIAYAALSPRTDQQAFEQFCEEMEYKPVSFTAFQTVEGQRQPIYHTNVMMCVAEGLAVVCLDTIDDAEERKLVRERLEATGHEIVEISEEQKQRFAGNMLCVKNLSGDRFMVMSASAHSALNPEQIKAIESKFTIISSSLDTIEACGGGSARCMMAEVFLPESTQENE